MNDERTGDSNAADAAAGQSVAHGRAAAGPAPTLQGSTATELEPEVCQHFAQVDQFRLVPSNGEGDASQGYLGVGRLAQPLDSGARDELSASLVGALAGRGLTVMPVLLTARAWAELDAQAPQAQWIDCLRPADGTQKQLELFGSRGLQPRTQREWLLRLVRDRAAMISTLRHVADLPAHATLQLCVTVAREVLQLSFAIAGEVFGDDARAIETAQQHAGDMPLGPADVQAYLALVGELEQARFVERLLGDVDRHTPDPTRALIWSERLLRRLEQHGRTHLVTADERRRTRRRRIIGGIAAAVTITGVLVGYLIATSPRDPLADMSRITKPGGIQGSYFKGVKFNELAFEHHDPRIRLSGRGSPDARLPADRFSVRWQGYLRFRDEGSHTVCVESDDGSRLFFDGEQIAGDWSKHPRRRSCATVRVRAGWYPIKVEYFQSTGDAVMRLLVGPDDDHLTQVRSKDLCCR